MKLKLTDILKEFFDDDVIMASAEDYTFVPIKNPKIGDKVRVVMNTGVDSEKTGTVVNHSEVKTDGRGVPTNIQGAYKPVDWKKEVAVKLDGGKLITMFKSRLSKI